MTNIYIHCKIQSNDCRIQSVFDHCLGIASKYGNKCKQQNSTKKYPFWSLPSVQIADYRTVTPDFHRSKHLSLIHISQNLSFYRYPTGSRHLMDRFPLALGIKSNHPRLSLPRDSLFRISALVITRLWLEI